MRRLSEKLTRLMLGPALVGVVLSSAQDASAPAHSQATKRMLPKEKQTTLELYVTSKEAYEKCRANPEKVKILDVRTNEEFLFVGHAPMAWNVPIFVQKYEWDATKGEYPMAPNPDFLTEVAKVAKPTDTLLVTCRSGGRSAMAVNQLAQAGFKNAYNITDGFEGDTIKDPDSVFDGQHMKNGWKNSGLPLSYEVSPERMVVPNATNL
jgi:rhodanese-related sulfurtransferase